MPGKKQQFSLFFLWVLLDVAVVGFILLRIKNHKEKRKEKKKGT